MNSRRVFLGGLTALALQSCAGQEMNLLRGTNASPKIYHPYYNEAQIDLSEVLTRPVVNPIGRLSPNLTWPYSPTWEEHLTREGYLGKRGIPGTDYAPISIGTTKIVPVATGIVTAIKRTKNSGWVLEIFHGGFFYTQYLHLKERPYAQLGEIVNRNAIVGLMGSEGDWAESEHLHIIAYANQYIARNMRFHHLHEHGVLSIAPTTMNIDPFEASVLGRHRELPFQRPEDVRLDEQHEVNVKEARNYINGIIMEFYPKLWEVIKEDQTLTNVYQDTDFVRDFLFLYRDVSNVLNGIRDLSILDDRLPAFKAMAPQIKQELEQKIKLLVPRFTAPIMEPGKRFYDERFKKRHR